MIIGVPKETKDHEYRVGLVPAGVYLLRQSGHRILIERGAGEGSGIHDEEYIAAGAEMVETADEVFGESELIVKVKEPLPAEYARLRCKQAIFTFLHLAPAPELVRALREREVTAIAYETIRDEIGSLPLLTPMSEIAGRMSIQIGAYYLQKTFGGRGELLSGVPGVAPANVVILGGGTVGTSAAKIAVGFGARVTIIEKDLRRLRYLDDIFYGRIEGQHSNPYSIREAVMNAELLVGAVLIPGASTPKLVTREMVRTMKKGAVILDVAVDQGGCIETSRPTTHSDPVYLVDGVLHYCVANMPGAVPRTSTFALTNATLPYVMRLASSGIERAIREDEGLRSGVNLYLGQVTCRPVAEAQSLKYTPIEKLLP